MVVRANADTPLDVRMARAWGAEGIGLCRTEPMFFEETRIVAVREVLLAEDARGRTKALARLLQLHREDFAAIFREMDTLPVAIRLLDLPLSELLPTEPNELEQLAKSLGLSARSVAQRASDMRQKNLAVGHRGCRLAITFPELYATQVRAILEAAAKLREEGLDVHPEIVIPRAVTREELDRVRSIIDRVATEVRVAATGPVTFSVGARIELPRAALLASELAHAVDFFSFDTDELTEATMGLSRDDAGKFLPAYLEAGILAKDPFVSIDGDGVGALVQMAAERGRKACPGLKLGVAGAHGGDPASIAFFHKAGFDCVSSSPSRVPVARLAAAQAALNARPREGGHGSA